ncbi:8-amino-7-oxononanoate synthase [Thauera aromatica]|uniref:8-amino-7-oxononanoate synthase n=1 Tax=Thauera aromatica TaxID=59405 RepID=UPI001FFCA9A3|nr:8-amino-7-oxononanoate synthase [Thauera aromatica]MCK2086693.1 8-amino-7-oxononanoate synthase [Thauera aromatica]
MSLRDDLHAGLAALERDALRRRRRSNTLPCAPRAQVDGRALLAFGSNDYLGLAAEPALAAALAAGAQRFGTGAGASHLVTGHHAVHDELETALARFVGTERALYFSTGYMANSGVLPALLGRGDAVFSDRLNHASLVDGMLLSRAAIQRYPHLDLAALDALLERSTARRKAIVTDAVFSMDGDVAPLPALLERAARHDAWLVVDDAHGFGVLGPQGRGTVAEAGLGAPPEAGLGAHPEAWRIVLIGTLGKAAGVAGAFVAGDATLVEWLLQKTRTYIFTTGAPPALAHALLESLRLIEAGDGRRAHLHRLIALFRARVRLQRWRLLPSRTPIQPVVIGDNDETLAVSAALEAAGLWVPAIRPPTVPAGSARLRVSLSAAHHEDEVIRLADTLSELERQSA